jgi:hypothetical protein
MCVDAFNLLQESTSPIMEDDYSVIMLVTGYFGEVVYTDMAASGVLFQHILHQVYEIWLVQLQPAAAAGGEVLKAHNKTMLVFVLLVDLAIHPLGHMITTGWYNGIAPVGNIDVAYNIADAINKIGFNYNLYLAVKSSKKTVKPSTFDVRIKPTTESLPLFF